MIKRMDLSGDWAFALDADKTGIEQGIFRSLPTDTITLPGTTSIAKKGTPSDKKEIGFLTDPYLFEGYAWYAKERFQKQKYLFTFGTYTPDSCLG